MEKLFMLVIMVLLCVISFSQAKNEEAKDIFKNAIKHSDTYGSVDTKESMRFGIAKDYEYLTNTTPFGDPKASEIANANLQPMSHKLIRVVLKLENSTLIGLGIIIFLSILINVIGLTNIYKKHILQ